MDPHGHCLVCSRGFSCLECRQSWRSTEPVFGHHPLGYGRIDQFDGLDGCLPAGLVDPGSPSMSERTDEDRGDHHEHRLRVRQSGGRGAGVRGSLRPRGVPIGWGGSGADAGWQPHRRLHPRIRHSIPDLVGSAPTDGGDRRRPCRFLSRSDRWRRSDHVRADLDRPGCSGGGRESAEGRAWLARSCRSWEFGLGLSRSIRSEAACGGR